MIPEIDPRHRHRPNAGDPAPEIPKPDEETVRADPFEDERIPEDERKKSGGDKTRDPAKRRR